MKHVMRYCKISAAIMLLVPGIARANSMPINFLPPEFFSWLFGSAGVLGMLLSAALGIAGLVVASRLRLDSSARVFARGFLGVSAVLCFAVSAMLIAFSMGDKPWISSLALSLTFIFLAIEFVIAGYLYNRIHENRKSAATRLLSVISYLLSAVFALVMIILLGFMFQGVPVAEIIILVIAGGLVTYSAYVMINKGLPGTAGGIARYGVLNFSAFLIAFISLVMMSTAAGKHESGPALAGIFIGLDFIFLGGQAIFWGWLAQRAARMRQKSATVTVVALYIIGGLICLVTLLAMMLDK